MSDPAAAPAPAALLLSDDLIFASRITGTARGLGQQVQVVRSGQQLKDLAAKQPPRCILLDLAVTGLDGPALIGGLKKISVPAPVIVAYGSHVDAATLRAARQAGADVVLPRSKFVEDLPEALPSWLAGSAWPPFESEARGDS
jgi:CheY-like chemotaxis protein